MVSQTGSRPCTDVSYVRPKECFDLAVTALNRHITIPIQGSLTQTTVFRTLVGMAVMQQSIHSISSLLEKSSCETSLRYHLAKLSMDDLEAANSTILTHSVWRVYYAWKAVASSENCDKREVCKRKTGETWCREPWIRGTWHILGSPADS